MLAFENGIASIGDIARAETLAVVDITSPIELNSRVGAANGELCRVTQSVVGANEWTLYFYDSASTAPESIPYLVNASGSGQWIAVAGKYGNGSRTFNAGLTASAASFTSIATTSAAAIAGTLSAASASIAGALSAASANIGGTITGSAASLASLTTTSAASISGLLTASTTIGIGVASTVSAGGSSTLTSASKCVQVVTGASTHGFTLPAANALGAGLSLVYIVKNRSAADVTITRAGSDTIDGSTTTVLLGGTNAAVTLVSDGSAAWEQV